jgi:hypothetical protein
LQCFFRSVPADKQKARQERVLPGVFMPLIQVEIT